jgi:putative peptidoglycan lipid II flippase
MLKKVTKNTSIVSFGTGISMVLGFARDILVARFFGTSSILEAFIVSFRIPNLFRSIFGEGFSDSVATPVLSEFQEDKEKLFKTGRNLISLSIIILFVCTLLGILFAKFFVVLLAPGFLKDPYRLNMAVSFTRITFLYLLFVGLSVNSFSILYALKRFFIPAVTPAFLNISFIIGLLFLSRVFEEYILVACVLGGGVLQLLFPFWFLCREGFEFRFNVKGLFGDKALIRMLKLSGPRIISSIVYQLSVIIDTVLASFTRIVGPGALAALWYANRYVHFPLALFIHAVCRVAIVDLSFYHSQKRSEDFKKLFVFSFQNVIFFIIPISIIYMFLARPIIEVILMRGDFDVRSAAMTASVLFFYSFGLFFFCGIKLLVNIFYALKDTVTPAKVTVVSLVANVLMSVALMFPLKIGGIALGSSLAAILNFFILYRILIQKIGIIDWQDTRSHLIKVVVLSVFVALASRFLWGWLGLSRYIKAVIVGAGSLSLFLLGGYVAGLKQIHFARRWISGRK